MSFIENEGHFKAHIAIQTSCQFEGHATIYTYIIYSKIVTLMVPCISFDAYEIEKCNNWNSRDVGETALLGIKQISDSVTHH